jgi:hypothetical protein
VAQVQIVGWRVNAVICYYEDAARQKEMEYRHAAKYAGAAYMHCDCNNRDSYRFL